MPFLAHHLLAELYGCDPAQLDDVERVRHWCLQLAEHAGATVRDVSLHRFEPQGVSGVLILAESHLAIHTWPEHGFCSVEIFVCGESADPMAGYRWLVETLGPDHAEVQVIGRGDRGKLG